MNPDHVEFAQWDAAYVLGALSPADRRLFETHLAECARCREAIVEIAPLTGLLARVPPERAASLDDTDEQGPDASGRARLVGLGIGEARRRRRTWWAGGLAAAAVIVVAIVIAVTALRPIVGDRETIALDPVVDVPLTASVQLTDVAWGTRLDLECRYEAAGSGDGWPYALYVTAVDGTVSEVSSWRAYAGTTARLTAGTALDAEDIAALEIRSADGDTVLMRSELPGGD
jgi:hypothetical protein